MCRGVEAALMTAARSKPHREITNCFLRRSRCGFHGNGRGVSVQNGATRHGVRGRSGR